MECLKNYFYCVMLVISVSAYLGAMRHEPILKDPQFLAVLAAGNIIVNGGLDYITDIEKKGWLLRDDVFPSMCRGTMHVLNDEAKLNGASSRFFVLQNNFFNLVRLGLDSIDAKKYSIETDEETAKKENEIRRKKEKVDFYVQLLLLDRTLPKVLDLNGKKIRYLKFTDDSSSDFYKAVTESYKQRMYTDFENSKQAIWDAVRKDNFAEADSLVKHLPQGQLVNRLHLIRMIYNVDELEQIINNRLHSGGTRAKNSLKCLSILTCHHPEIIKDSILANIAHPLLMMAEDEESLGKVEELAEQIFLNSGRFDRVWSNEKESILYTYVRDARDEESRQTQAMYEYAKLRIFDLMLGHMKKRYTPEQLSAIVNYKIKRERTKTALAMATTLRWDEDRPPALFALKLLELGACDEESRENLKQLKEQGGQWLEAYQKIEENFAAIAE